MRGKVCTEQCELFKVIPEWPNYEVSNAGCVRSLRRRVGYHGHGVDVKTKELVPLVHANGYHYVRLSDGLGGWRIEGIHRLVLLAFVRPPLKGQVACHYPDPNKANNNLSNLRWVYQWENETHKPEQGSKQKRLTKEEIGLAWRMRKAGATQSAIAKTVGVHQSAICGLLSGKY